jgi:transposase
MERAGREVWEQRIRRWTDSGLTAREFASEIGVNLHTLRQWKYKLEERGAATSDAETATSRPTFVEVHVPRPSAAARAANSEPFELELPNGLKVRVPMHFDATALKALIVALGAH